MASIMQQQALQSVKWQYIYDIPYTTLLDNAQHQSKNSGLFMYSFGSLKTKKLCA